ncbi:FxLYD domain-containing protein [Streptomyces sp. NPDC002845]
MSGLLSARNGRARLAGVVTAALMALTVGCTGDDDTPSDIASVVSSAAEEAQEAQEKFREIRDGIVATGDVEVRETAVEDGRVVAELTVTNSGDDTDSYTIQVNFHDRDGDLVDVVLVTVDSVEPGKTAKATARSHRDVPERTTAEVITAVRY